MVDLSNQNMGGVTCLIKSCTPMHLNKSQNHGQESCIQPS